MLIYEIEKDELAAQEEKIEEQQEQIESAENKEEQVEASAAAEEETPVQPDIKYEDIVLVLKQYFNALRDSIRLAKTKDDVISKMKNELNKYREDFSYSLLKPIITNLISFREDNKSTLRNIEKFSNDVETSKKYLSYLNDDFVDMLSNFGIEIEEDKFLLDGVNLDEIKMHKVNNFEQLAVEESATEGEETPVAEAAEETPVEEKPYSLQDVLDLVNENKNNIESILKENSLMDESFKDVEAIASSIDRNYADAILLPAYKEITKFYAKLNNLISKTCESMTEENKTSSYQDVLIFAISTVSEILTHFGVEIDVDISNVYDMKINRMLKFVPTDKIELDKTIAFRHTDSYFYNGKPIYLCKVDVYKYEQK